ncbi:MAG: AAA family ATPase [Planctomycetes bacterium]|nr:AAA family ATPase [Planctomycetota bacterium]
MPETTKGATKTQAPGTHLRPLAPAALRWRCDPGSLGFDSTAEVEPVAGVVGQDAAVEALRFGLGTNAPGQNIFVRGLSGTGRLTLVRRQLEEIRPVCPEIKDCCYAHDFSQPERPRLITLPAGQGPAFRRRVDKLADFIRDNLNTALSSEGLKTRRAALDESTEAQLRKLVQPFEKSLKKASLTLVNIQAGAATQTAIFPMREGKAVPPEQFEELHAQGQVSDADYQAARDNYTKFERELAELNERANELRQRHDDAVGKLLEGSARTILEKVVNSILTAFPQSCVETFLREVVDDVVQQRLGELDGDADFTAVYRVNVVLDHQASDRCPIIVENAPTLRNLLGTIDLDFEGGETSRPTHLGIRAGSLLRADGGYLILEDRDVLSEPGAWKVLMRVLRTGRLEITPPDSPLQGWTPALKPEPIDIKVKVVMVGDPFTYALLDEHDPDFPQMFKVLADFDSIMPRDEAGLHHYAAVLARITREEHLPALDATAVAALVEHGARIASRAGRISARFGRIADIAREAAFVCGEGNCERVTADHVRTAIRRGKRRADLPSRRFREYVADGTIRVETKGRVVGQLNGLAVLQSGPLTYGSPTRITATIGPGTAGVINIEREAELSGAIHTKGFYILGGLLRYLLRTDHPLAFDASIAFEQSYGAIDGDSASGAEMCCLLSALTDIPLRQDLAMTGAIDQMGHILAVGAVSEKIEGFFDCCHDLGMTGTQGVVIPQANAGDLMLREDVVEACAAGQFQVYTVKTVHEALELLASTPAGERNLHGKYPKNSVLGVAVERARAYWLNAARPPARARSRHRARA